MSEDFNIFSIGVEDIDTHEQQQSTGGNTMYKPTADDGKDGTYKALIRFVPNVENPRNSLIKKYVNWLTGPDGSSKLVDSPSSIGESCPIADAFWKLRKSDSAVDRKASDKLKRREQYVSLVKIIKDPQFPELEGTYRIFKFGYKIKEKIDAELKPDFGEPTQVFDLFEGKNFELIITRQNDYNNYDKSKFSSSKSPIVIGDDNVPAERVEKDMADIKQELEDAPSLKSFEYQAWDEPTREFVNSVIKMYLNPGNAMEEVTNTTFETSTPKKVETPKKEVVTEVAGSNSSNSAKSEGGDDLESFLNDLEI